MASERTRAHDRLHDELTDDGIVLPGDGDPSQRELVNVLLHELDVARRPPVFEGRSAAFGTFVMRDEASLVPGRDLVEVIDFDLPLDQARRFAEGR